MPFSKKVLSNTLTLLMMDYNLKTVFSACSIFIDNRHFLKALKGVFAKMKRGIGENY